MWIGIEIELGSHDSNVLMLGNQIVCKNNASIK